MSGNKRRMNKFKVIASWGPICHLYPMTLQSSWPAKGWPTCCYAHIARELLWGRYCKQLWPRKVRTAATVISAATSCNNRWRRRTESHWHRSRWDCNQRTHSPARAADTVIAAKATAWNDSQFYSKNPKFGLTIIKLYQWASLRFPCIAGITEFSRGCASQQSFSCFTYLV